MCTDAITPIIFENAAIMEKMSNPILDFVHKQVVITLYSLEAAKRLEEYRDVLPTYLSTDWPECEAILRTLEQAGLVSVGSDGIALTHRVEIDNTNSCGCH